MFFSHAEPEQKTRLSRAGLRQVRGLEKEKGLRIISLEGVGEFVHQ